MMEIDFLPEWYKVGRKRKVSYKRQYTAITSLFAILVLWSFVAGHSASLSAAKIKEREAYIRINSGLEQECEKIKSQLTDIGLKAGIIDKITPRLDFASVMAELAYIVNQNIMVTRLDVNTEDVNTAEGKSNNKPGAVVPKNAQKQSESVLPPDEQRFKVTLSGIAASAQDVAVLISRLESSPYFCEIIPGFSRTQQVKGRAVTEFQIDCYVANYLR